MVGNMVRAAVKAARKAIESTYTGTLTVTEYQEVMNEVTKLTGFEEVTVIENQPCRLSFETLQAASQSDSTATVTQTTKLFVSPEITIKPGSKITVTQAGVTTDYTHSGVPAVYETHQEIILELFERWV